MYLLSKLHELALGHTVLFRGSSHGNAAVLVRSGTVLVKGGMLRSEFAQWERSHRT